MPARWTIVGESRGTAAALILSVLIERGLAPFDRNWLHDRIDRHDWIEADDLRLAELAAEAGIDLRLLPFSEEAED